jgi:NAD(P)-dependent dehydrogenase (short-subunit alcohol dehydrogenase family)
MEQGDTRPAAPHRSALAVLVDGFRDAVVVVVGGRGGIGREVVRQTHELGARVIIVSGSAGARQLDRDEFERTRQVVLRADIRVPADLRQLADEIDAAEGRVDVLVNTAGSSVQVPLRALERLTDEVIAEAFQSNAIGVLTTIRELVPLLRKGRAPVIVNVGSVAAWTGQGSNLAYVGAKGAVDAMSVGLAKALAPDIRVVGVAPSALETDFVKGRGAEFFDATIAATPLRRLTSVTEVASAVLCAARVLTATTGVTIAVDGGRHL